MARPLTVVPPVEITDSMLVSTNVLENEHPNWNPSTTYANAQRVILPDAHKVYESMQGANTNHAPDAVGSVAWWALVGPTNRWRLFDSKNSTRTANPYSINYVFRPGKSITTFAALDLQDVSSIRVRAFDTSAGLVYERTMGTVSVPIETGWHAWFFGARTRSQSSLQVLQDLPPAYPNLEIEVNLIGGANLAVGVMLVGIGRQIGLGVLQGARFGIDDFSRIQRNDFGDVVIVPRLRAKTLNITFPLPIGEVDAALEFLEPLRTSPALYIGGSENLRAGTVLGFYETLEMIVYGKLAECSLQIRGTI